MKIIPDDEVVIVFKKLMPRSCVIENCGFRRSVVTGQHQFFLDYRIAGYREIGTKKVYITIDEKNHPVDINALLTKIILSVYGDSKDVYLKRYF